MGNSMAVRSLGILVAVCVLGRFRGVIAVTPIPNDQLLEEARKWCGTDNEESRNDDYGSISDWDTSLVTDMSAIFLGDDDGPFPVRINGKEYNGDKACAGFNADISKWDTSGVKSMAYMFASSGFNGDISKWDTSKVTSFFGMFTESQAFNGDISKWDTSKVTSFFSMFSFSPFNGDISKWDTSKVTSFHAMFSWSQAFNGDISKWDTSKVTDFDSMFAWSRAFNGDISKWDTSKATSFRYMFASSGFNGDISKWDTSKVISFYWMFEQNNKFNINYTAFWNTGNPNIDRPLSSQPCPMGLGMKLGRSTQGTVAARCWGYNDTACAPLDDVCGTRATRCIAGYINDEGQAINTDNAAEVMCVCPRGYSGDQCNTSSMDDQDSTAPTGDKDSMDDRDSTVPPWLIAGPVLGVMAVVAAVGVALAWGLRKGACKSKQGGARRDEVELSLG